MFLAEGASSSGSDVLAILGSLGGIAVFIGGVWAIIQAILKQVTATKANTTATDKNTRAIEDLKKEMVEVKGTVNVQAERISGQGREIADLRRVVFNGGGRQNSQRD